MRKVWNDKILIVACVMMLLSGCANSGKNIPIDVPVVKDEVQKVSINIYDDYMKCKSKEYINLDISNCNLAITSIYASELVVEQKEAVYEPKVALEKFNEYCEFFFESECIDEDSKIFSSLQVPNEYPPGFDPDKDKLSYVPYPKVKDHQSKIDNNEIEVDGFMYRDLDNGKYLWLHNSTEFPHCVNKGKTYNFVKSDSVISAWFASDLPGSVKTVYNNGHNEDVTYTLLDGNTISVQTAIDYFENEYLKTLPVEIDESYSVKVYSVDIIRIDEDKYVYLLNFSTAWDGVSFDHNVEMVCDSDISSRFSINGEAIYCGVKDIDYYRNLQFPTVIEEGETYDEVCSLENAIDIMSGKLTQNVKFEVISIDYVYRGTYGRKINLKPWWRFVTYNPNDNKYYNVYVSAKDGECNYFSYVLL